MLERRRKDIPYACHGDEGFSKVSVVVDEVGSVEHGLAGCMVLWLGDCPAVSVEGGKGTSEHGGRPEKRRAGWRFNVGCERGRRSIHEPATSIHAARRRKPWRSVPARRRGYCSHLPGKTSFLRLLLDSLAPSHSLPCAGRTTLFTTTHVLVNIDAALVPLTLIDSPSLDFSDELTAERTLADTLRLIAHRFLDDLDRRHVHLCVSSSPLSTPAHPP